MSRPGSEGGGAANRPTCRTRRGLIRRAAVVVAVAAVLLTGCTVGGSGRLAGQALRVADDSRPNIVFVLTDDLSMNLLPYLPQVQQMRREGTAFTNYTVTDSLCCPSRSSIFTGRFPHGTGIFTNSGSDGGFGAFHARGEESQTFAVALQRAGYRTGMMGKYLNGYEPADKEGGKQTYVPPGWSEWDVAGQAYPEFDYNLNENHRVVHYGHRPQDYLTDVLAGKGVSFIRTAAASGSPFMLEIATFAPHSPFTPAPRDTARFPGLKAPRSPALDKLPANAPSWLARRLPLSSAERRSIDTRFRRRAQAVQAVDKMIGRLRAALTAAGVADNTYVVFSSDNGYHMGEYRLNPGKMTAFDTDVRVPLVVIGPNVSHGQIGAPAENIDLAPTFAELGGAHMPSTVDGHSLATLLHGASPPGWRTAALVEHHGPDTSPNDPDLPAKGSGNPTTYEALRTRTVTYVEYSNGEREYYDRTSDPDELHNTFAQLLAATKAKLHAALTALSTCHGSANCWEAGHAYP